MNPHKNLFAHLSEWWETRKKLTTSTNWQRWLPTPGNIIFTLLIVGLMVVTQQVWANEALLTSLSTAGTGATTVNYQGRLADPLGNPQNDTFGMSFAIWDMATGGNIVWGPESHDSVSVSDGLFSIGLGSKTNGGIPTTVWDGDRYLEITVAGETLAPRELIRSVPIAGMALTVPDEAITINKLSPTAVGYWTMLPNGQLFQHHSSGAPQFNWQVADISEIVPTSTQIAYIKLFLRSTSGTGNCRVRPLGSSHNGGTVIVRTHSANTYYEQSGLIALDAGKFEYTCALESGATISDAGIELWGFFEAGH